MATQKSKTDAVAYRWQRFYPALQTGHCMTVKSKQRREDMAFDILLERRQNRPIDRNHAERSS